jgi:S1-C subfamily serine protease
LIRLIPPEGQAETFAERVRRVLRPIAPVAAAAILALVVVSTLWNLPSARRPTYPILRETPRESLPTPSVASAPERPTAPPAASVEPSAPAVTLPGAGAPERPPPPPVAATVEPSAPAVAPPAARAPERPSPPPVAAVESSQPAVASPPALARAADRLSPPPAVPEPSAPRLARAADRLSPPPVAPADAGVPAASPSAPAAESRPMPPPAAGAVDAVPGPPPAVTTPPPPPLADSPSGLARRKAPSPRPVMPLTPPQSARAPSRNVETPPLPPAAPAAADRRPPDAAPAPVAASPPSPPAATERRPTGEVAARAAVPPPLPAPPPNAVPSDAGVPRPPVESPTIQGSVGSGRAGIPGAPAGGGGASLAAASERGTGGRPGTPVAARAENGTRRDTSTVAAPAPPVNGTPASPPAPRVVAAPQAVAASVAPAVVTVRARGRAGAGFVVDPAGYIVTSNRLVTGARAIEVTLHDGRTLPVTLVGRDPLTDIAVLKVAASGLHTARLGTSSGLRIGDPVVAVGKRRGRPAEVTVGAIRATGAATGGDLALDVPVAPDSAGAPLLNARGEVVAVATGTRGTAGQAVPIDRVKPMLRDLTRSASATSFGILTSVER